VTAASAFLWYLAIGAVLSALGLAVLMAGGQHRGRWFRVTTDFRVLEDGSDVTPMMRAVLSHPIGLFFTWLFLSLTWPFSIYGTVRVRRRRSVAR